MDDKRNQMNMSMKKTIYSAALMAAVIFSGCSGNKEVHENKSEQVNLATSDGRIKENPLRDAYFGDLHLHTTLSFDAFIMGTQVGPEDGYKFAKGGTINYLGTPITNRRPLDFMAVTDHSEYMGVENTIHDPNSALAKTAYGKKILNKDPQERFQVVYAIAKNFSKGQIIPDMNQTDVIKSTWQRVIKAANDYYEPGKFTTFIGYEWSAIPDGQNLHRNVIFRGDKAPENTHSSNNSPVPEDLWTYLENSRKQGYDAIAITHNANVSDGKMFDLKDSKGNLITREYAERRIANEPIAEISQTKGQSETHPGLSPDDEFANFEIVTKLLTADKNGKVNGSYAREALGRGLAINEKVGVNPYKFGFIGSTDLHNGFSFSDEYNGGMTGYSDSLRRVSSDLSTLAARLQYGSGGIAGVWAESNTREAIFDAFKRKETFATSGTRLKIRFFASWDYDKNLLQDNNWIKKAYDKGVPMGGDLPKKPSEKKSPSFVIWTIKDPQGANLDRAQVIKVWTKDGKNYEKVYDVLLSDNRKIDPKTGKASAVGNTVDLKTGAYENSIGDVELKGDWADPEFDPSIAAAYYVRVIEIPTPRWSTLVAIKAGGEIPKNAQVTIQERGWSSPIWYAPQK